MNRDNPDRAPLGAAGDTAAMVTRTARYACALLAVGAAAAVHARDSYINASSGAPLRPGVYGRIEVRGAPPPLISQRPLVANKSIGPVLGEPLYFYLPAGQVRKWALYCQQYAACERPVYFVRVDNTPGKLGRWKARERLLKQRDAGMLSAQADQPF